MKSVNYTYSGHVTEELRQLAQRACDMFDDATKAESWFVKQAGRATGVDTFCFTECESKNE